MYIISSTNFQNITFLEVGGKDIPEVDFHNNDAYIAWIYIGTTK